MKNYKIRVPNEAESKEVISLFIQLGYNDAKSKRFGFVYTTGGQIGCDQLMHWDHYSDRLGFQEISLSQLRDLVVLHRNDENDANWETESGDQIYKDSSGKSFIFREESWDELQRHEMRQAMWAKPKLPSPIFAEMSEVKEYLDPDENYSYHKVPVIAQGSGWIEIPDGDELLWSREPIQKAQPEIIEGLISGADAKKYWAKGENVQILCAFGDFCTITTNLPLSIFDNLENKFRLKPRNILINGIEVPSPMNRNPEDDEIGFS